MEQVHTTPYSHLTDQEFLRHLLHKEDPTAEDVEAALRLELLLDSYSALLEEIHRTSNDGLEGNEDAGVALSRISDMTAPAKERSIATAN